MSQQIKDVLSAKLKIDITPALANAIIKFVNAYETRGTHPEAFNTPYLGLHPCHFLNKDRDDFFDMFDVDQKEFSNIVSDNVNRSKIFGIAMRDIVNYAKDTVMNFFKGIKNKAVFGITNNEMRKLINEIGSIDKNFLVVSDPFNVFIVYLLHRITVAKLDEKLKEQTIFKTIMLLQYKFFTSLVNYRFRYRPDEAAMIAMYESLTAKFDIKQYGTWKKVMESRAITFAKKDSLHYPTFVNFDDDKKILYIITDIQTRIRNQINIVTEEFMKTKEQQDKFGSYSHIGTDLEGDKVVNGEVSGYDMMISSIYNDAMSYTRFVDEEVLRICNGLFNSISIHMLRSFIIAFSENAVKQAKAGQSDLVKEVNGEIVSVGAHILIQNIIQKTYRYCIQNNVNMTQFTNIVKAVKDVYGSSRISDEGILHVKNSVGYLIQNIYKIEREATFSALRIAFVLYIIILSSRYLR